MQKPDGLIGLLALAASPRHRAPGAARPSRRRRAHRGAPQRQGHPHHAAAPRARPQGHARAVELRLGRPALPLAARRRNRRRRRARGLRRAEVPRPLARPRPPSTARPRARGPWRTSCCTRPPCACAWSTLTASSMHVTIRYALTREQVSQAENAGKRAKKHFSGLRHSGWGDGGALSALPGHADPARSLARHVGQAARGRASSRGPSSSASPCTTSSRRAISSPRSSPIPNHRADLAATMDKLNLKYGNTTLHFAAMLPARRVRPNPHLLHPDPGEVRRGLHLNQFCSEGKALLRRRIAG